MIEGDPFTMAIESVPARVTILVVFNLPIFVGLGSIFFSSWSEFFKSFVPGFDFGFWSWVLDWHTYMTWENGKLYLFLIIVVLALYGEYRFFWSNPPTPPPIQFISSLSSDRPKPQLNSAPAGIAFRSFSSFRNSAPLVDSAQAGSVCSIR